MYIQQECLFSFEEILNFQSKSKLEMILSELSFDNLISELKKSHTKRGPNGYPIQTLINAFIAMQVERIPTLTDLSEKLKTDGRLADWGAKKDTDGNKIKWFGYKLHILCDCKSELPLSILLSPASYYDGELAKPLIKKYLTHYSGVLNTKYYLMDSGYDQEKNYTYIIDEAKAIPIIAYNKRGAYAPPEGFNENFQPICSMGYPLTYWGKDGNYLKYRCPHATGKINCIEGTCWCSNSNYGYCKKININNNPRLISYPPRHSEQFIHLYNKRTSVERCNSRLKGLLNVDNLRSAGILKAKVFALLNCIALVSGTISVNRVKNNNLSVA